MSELTIVFPIRNIEAQRIYNCLHSLRLQASKKFKIILSDYGSSQKFQNHIQKAILKVNSKLDLSYIYTNTKDTWNRSAALNRGLIHSTTQFVMGSDIDMLFHPYFFEEIFKYLSNNNFIIHHKARQLKNFPLSSLEFKMRENNWDFFYKHSKERKTKGTGACQVIPRNILFELGGYDEVYKHWGAEDDDMRYRLKKYGLNEINLSDKITFFHQWHESNKKDYQKIEENRVYLNNTKQNNYPLIRNNGAWN